MQAIEAINVEGGAKVKRVTMLSSIGVKRRWQFPFSFLNFFGVLDAKAAGEEAIIQGAARCNYDFAVVRPGRLVGGPYTGTPDVATLLKMDEGDLQVCSRSEFPPPCRIITFGLSITVTFGLSIHAFLPSVHRNAQWRPQGL